MLDFLKKRKANGINAQAPVVENTTTPQVPIQQQKYDFVEQYTLTQPKELMFGYDCWSDCRNVPVRYEQNGNNSGFAACVELPSIVFFRWWKTIQTAPQEVLNNPKSRTISIVNLKNGKKFFILPNVKDIKRPIYAYEVGSLSTGSTPEINRAIVEQIKTFTR